MDVSGLNIKVKPVLRTARGRRQPQSGHYWGRVARHLAMDVLSIDLSAAERRTYRESRDSGVQLPPLGRNPSELVRAYEAGEDRTDLLREARYLQFMRPYEADIKPLVQRLFLSRAGDPARIGEDRLQLEKVKPIYRGDFEDPEALTVFGECVKTCYNDWWESVRHGPFPPPFSLTRAHRRTVRGPHIVMRALLERRRAMLGKDALFVIYNLYRRMPDPMFRVILSFL